jgi:hypothetical protein
VTHGLVLSPEFCESGNSFANIRPQLIIETSIKPGWTHNTQTGNTQTTHKQHTNTTLTTHKQRTNNTQTTHKQHSNNTQTGTPTHSQTCRIKPSHLKFTESVINSEQHDSSILWMPMRNHFTSNSIEAQFFIQTTYNIVTYSVGR